MSLVSSIKAAILLVLLALVNLTFRLSLAVRLHFSTTVLVLTLGSGVDGFTLDPDTGRFLHTHCDIRIPSSGPIYSFNEANFRDFDQPVRRFLTSIKEQKERVGGKSSKPTVARYIGALVADTHNVLINGGIYGYPATFQNRNGKLRLMYESNPMAMIMEQAGGAASTGYGRILDVKPTDIHQRVPTFLGSMENVFELGNFERGRGSGTTLLCKSLNPHFSPSLFVQINSVNITARKTKISRDGNRKISSSLVIDLEASI